MLGREREREVLDQLLHGVGRGRGGVLVVHGEADPAVRLLPVGNGDLGQLRVLGNLDAALQQPASV